MKIYLDKETGCAYWIENDPVAGNYVCFAPLTTGGILNTEDGGLVEQWHDDATQDRVLLALAGKENICKGCGTDRRLLNGFCNCNDD